MRFGNPLVGSGHAHARRWLPHLERVPPGSFGFFPCDFGVFSVLFGNSGSGFGALFSLRPSGLPFPPSVGFPFGPFWPWVFLSPAVLLHLASFSLG